jgi:hypothetical protein
MAEKITLKAQGLETDANQISQVPDGAMTVATNVVIDRLGVVESRRGLDRWHLGATTTESQFPDSSHVASKLAVYQGTIIAHTGTSVLTASKLAYDAGLSAMINFSGSYANPTGFTSRFNEANNNLYFTTSTGVYKLDAYNGTPTLAGMPAGIGCSAVAGAGTGSWMTTSYWAAYRIVWGYKDANKNLILGAPSSRVVSTPYAGGTGIVTLTIRIPSGITTSNFFQVYRSTATDSTTTVPTYPSDELQLVYEGYPTSTDISNGYVTVVDLQPDTVGKGAFLYTNAVSGSGILQSNDRPPVARDIVNFKGYSFYGNITELHRQYIQLLSVASSSGGLVDGDSISIGGRDYLYVASGATTNPPTGYKTFSYPTTVPTVATAQIEATAMALVDAINSDASQTAVYAYYDPVSGQLPGRIRIEERTPGGSGFVINANGLKNANSKISAWKDTFNHRILTASIDWNSTAAKANVGFVLSANVVTVTTVCDAHNLNTNDHVTIVGLNGDSYFDVANVAITKTGADTFTYPLVKANLDHRGVGHSAYAIYVTGTDITTATSAADRNAHGAAVSKFQEPEHVPLTNRIYVGRKDKAWLKAIALRDSLFIFKEDGIYRLTGETLDTFRVEEFDLTVELYGQDTPAKCGNQIYAMTSQGVVAVSEAGVQIVSKPIEKDLLALQLPTILPYLKTYSFGVGYESDRKYVIGMPTSATIRVNVVYAYNYLTKAWTIWDMPDITDPCCGIVHPTEDKLYMGDFVRNTLLVERKTRTSTDYADLSFGVTISTGSGTASTVTVANSYTQAQPAVGDVFWYSSSQYALITAVTFLGGSNWSLTLASAVTWGSTAGVIHKAIGKQVTWAVQTGAEPEGLKHWRECQVFTQDSSYSAFSLQFGSEFGTTDDAIVMTKTSGENGPERTYVTPNAQRCSQLTVSLTHSKAFETLQVSGMGLTFNPGKATRVK